MVFAKYLISTERNRTGEAVAVVMMLMAVVAAVVMMLIAMVAAVVMMLIAMVAAVVMATTILLYFGTK